MSAATKYRLRLVAIGVAVGLLVGTVAWLAGVKRGTPIAKQTCSELADTLRQIQATEDAHPLGSDDIGRKAEADGEALNERVDALGGCPNEPSLQ